MQQNKGKTLAAPGFAVVPAYPAEITAIDKQRRPSMLPITYQEDLSIMQGEANQYYLRKNGAGQVTFGVGLFPLKKGARTPTVRVVGPHDVRSEFEAFEIGDTIILVRNSGDGMISAGGVSTAASVAVARLQDGRALWKLEAKEAAK